MNLKFWKKKEDDDFLIDHDLKSPIKGVDAQYGTQPQDPLQSPQQTPPPLESGKDFTVKETPRPMQAQGQATHGNDELILAKLDAIKAMVENLSRRLERIEQIALEEERKGY
tara:strand:- start:9281 stop:9616 length:336 start_codon:yes stop_codon:yes gene_type:complete